MGPNGAASVGTIALLIPATVATDPPLAASNWPRGVLFAVPALAVLFVLAFVFARNSRERIGNLLFGLSGSIAAFVAVAYLADMPQYRWLLEGDACPIVASTATTIGAAAGVAASFADVGCCCF